MILIHDRASAARALAADLDPPMRAALAAELALLTAGDHDLTERGGVHRLVFTFGGTHATILLVPDDGGALADLCRRHA